MFTEEKNINTPNLSSPIFIVGCAKSGTTLLSSLLSMHPDVGPKDIDNKFQFDQEGLDSLLDEPSFNKIANTIERKNTWDKYFPIPNYISVRMGAELVMYHSHLSHTDKQQLKKELFKNCPQHRLLAKHPPNTFRIHALREIFPDAKIIAIHRDGRDVISSWGSKAGHSWKKMGGYITGIEIFARKWNESIDHLETFKSDLNICVINYETLVNSPDKTLAKVLSHCDLNHSLIDYTNIRLRNKHRDWISSIPAEHHELVNRLTYRNRRRLGYTDTEFDDLTKKELNTNNIYDFKDFYKLSDKQIHKCPICNSNQFKFMSNIDRHDIGLITSICTECSLVQCNPRCSNDWYEEFYRNHFWRLYIGSSEKNLTDLYIEDKQDYKGEKIGEFILDNLNSETNIRDYLDIGCGLGGLSQYFKNKKPSINVSVVEPSNDATEFIKSRSTEINIYKQSIEDLSTLNSSSFDLITMVHVLEHVQDPKSTLLEIKRLLRKNGTVYIEVPEFTNKSWSNKNYLHIAHKFIFDKDNIDDLATSCGLKIVKTFPSPVKKIWPWAFCVFLEHSDNTTEHIPKRSNHFIDKKIKQLQKKVTKKKLFKRKAIKP